MARQDTLDYTGRKLGRTQWTLLEALREYAQDGAVTADLREVCPGTCLRTLQESLKTLHSRGLVKKEYLRHNKYKWYYSDVATVYVEAWPELPPQAKKALP